ncbi:MAG: F0F1 ATP synthase subunit delta [Nitratireductor sp.]|nr:F0F1 ATP synthase subunit delta [Nitratireductor sp.]
MAQSSASPVSGVTERYAGALFELAVAEKKIDAVENDLQRFDALMTGSDDLMRLVRSPVFSSGDQAAAIDKLLTRAKIAGLTGNFIRVVARNRRLFVMPSMLAAFRRLAAAHRGEESAEVTVASPLSATQKKELKAALKSAVGKEVAIDEKVDPSLLGGMIVKIGSRQIDTSLKTKLSSLKLALKEVG